MQTRPNAAAHTITLLALTAVTANAQIRYTAQDRWVEIQAYLPGEVKADSLAAGGFGLFDQTLTDTLFNDDGSAWATASQTSQLSSNGITVSGAADGWAGPPVGTSAGVGRTSFFVGFSIADAVDYTLDLNIMGEFASWSFQGPSLDIDRAFDFAIGDPGVHLSGTLDAGDYAFSIMLESGAAAEGLGSNFDFAFSTVPAPGGTALLAATAIAGLRRRR